MRTFINQPRVIPVPSSSVAEDGASYQLPYMKQGLGYAFNYGSFCCLRQQARARDPEAITCPRCWQVMRSDAGDARCPLCQGGGWIWKDTMRGYSPRIFIRAHIEELDYEEQYTPEGLERRVTTRFWTNATSRNIRDGDLISRVEVDNPEEPKFILGIIQPYEVVSAKQPMLHPGSDTDPYGGSEASASVIAQQLDLVTIPPDTPEFGVDINQTIRYGELLNIPVHYTAGSDYVAWLIA